MERFWSKVLKTEGCWLWTASTFGPGGYGAFQVGSYVTRGAHRVAFELCHRPLLPGEQVLHSCDVKQCVNPAHLRAGSHKENMRDLAERGEGKNQHKNKTHCKAGHEFTEETTYRRPGKPERRDCWTCKRERRA